MKLCLVYSWTGTADHWWTPEYLSSPPVRSMFLCLLCFYFFLFFAWWFCFCIGPLPWVPTVACGSGLHLQFSLTYICSWDLIIIKLYQKSRIKQLSSNFYSFLYSMSVFLLAVDVCVIHKASFVVILKIQCIWRNNYQAIQYR